MSKIALIYPYFGKFPDIFFYWLMTMSYNTAFDIFIISDNEISFDLPKNVNYIKTSFDDFKQFVNKVFEFEISLDIPYKICDFRPAFGEIFSDLISDYSYWGYGDIDVICGDFASFINDEVLQKYERISQYGHLSIYRNSPKLNELYKNTLKGEKVYIDIFSDPLNRLFDEFWNEDGIEHIAKEHGIAEKRDLMIAGVERIYRKKKLSYRFELNGETLPDSDQNIFHWKDGKLMMLHLSGHEVIEKREFAYAHFQKRKLLFPMKEAILSSGISEFWIAPNRIIIGSLEDVFSYIDSDEYKEDMASEQEKFIIFRKNNPDVY